MKIRTYIKNDTAVACCVIPLTGAVASGRYRGAKQITLCAKVPLSAVRAMCEEMEKRGQVMGGREGDEVIGFFSKIKKAVKKVAKKVASSKLIKAANKLAKNPVVAAVLPPQVTAGIKLANMARGIVRSAKAGDKKAQAAVRLARAQARVKRAPTARNITRFKRARRRAQAWKGRKGGGAYQVRTPSGKVWTTLVKLSA